MYIKRERYLNKIRPFYDVDLTRREQEIPHLYRWRDELR